MLIRNTMAGALVALCGLFALPFAGAAENNLVPGDRPALSPWKNASAYGPPAPCGVIDRQMRILNPYPVLGEPLVVEFLFTYRPNRVEVPPAEVQAITALAWNTDIAATIQPEGMRPAAFEPESPGARGQRRALPLREGRPQRGAALMAYDKNTLSTSPFDDPGPHAVILYNMCVPPETESQALIGTPNNANEWDELGGVIVTVREPEGDDAIAWELLSGTGAFQSLQQQRIVSGSHRALLEQVVREAPGAAVTPYALTTLANALIMASNDDPEALLAPLAYLEQLLRDHPDAYLAPSAAQRAIDIHLLREDEAAARALFRRAWEHPNLSRSLVLDSRTADYFLDLQAPPFEEQWMLFGPQATAAAGSTP